MMRKAALERVGVYSTDKTRQPPEDFELWSRMAPEHRLRNLPEALVTQRHRSVSVSGNYSREAVRKVAEITIANVIQ